MKQSDRKKIGKNGMFEESAIFYRCRIPKNWRYLPIRINRHVPNPVPTYVSANQLLCNNFSLMMQRQRSDGILVLFCVIAALKVNMIDRNFII